MSGTVAKVLVASVEFIGMMVSGLGWANLLLGHSSLRGALMFAGSLGVMYLDSRLRRRSLPAVVLAASVLASLSAVAIQILIEPWVRVIARMMWLEGSQAIALNTSFALSFLVSLPIWLFLLWQHFANRRRRAG